jgi:2-isopropylmalate synthase
LRNITIFDTTLRDGEQAPGNEMSVKTKVELFNAIQKTGVQYVETGIPAASQVDFDATLEIARAERSVAVCAFARATVADIDIAVEALDGQSRTQVQILSTGSEIHAEHKRGMSLDALIEEIRRATTHARTCGVTDISIGYEDASRGSAGFLRPMIEAGVDAGATTVVLPDTVGAATPREAASLVSAARSWVGPSVSISVHFHNDLGLAVANSLAAVGAGADVVQTTFCGLGERAGNTALEELAAVLRYKGTEYGGRADIDLLRVREACEAVLESLNLTAWKHKPIIGRYAFSTAAGIHASGLERHPITYQFVEPELFGREAEVLISRASGRANLRAKLRENGLEYDEARVDRMYAMLATDHEPARLNNLSDLLDLYNNSKLPEWSQPSDPT